MVTSSWIHKHKIFFTLGIFGVSGIIGGILTFPHISCNPILQTKQYILNTKYLTNPFDLSLNKTVYTIPILIYHYVEYVKDPKDTIRKSLDIPPHIFEKQLTTLVNAGYTFVTMKEISMYLTGLTRSPQKPIALTFDDGYGDFYEVVYPVLKKHNIKATVYIVSGFIGKPNYMTERQVKEIATDNRIEIGAHTVNHTNLRRENQQTRREEISKSRITLQRLTQQSITSFAYPYGEYTDDIATQVANLGFSTAVSTKKGITSTWNTRYILPRIGPGMAVDQSLLSLIAPTLSYSSSLH